MNTLKEARIKYYTEKQETCMKDLTKAHVRLYEELLGRRFEDQEEERLFHDIYTLINDTLNKHLNDGPELRGR